MEFDEIQQIFFQECEEALLAIEGSFALCQTGDHDSETINTIFRGVHSIKGGAGAFGHEALQSFTHHYETLLDKLRNDELQLDAALLATLLAAFDTLSDHIAAAKGEGSTPADAEMLARLEAAAGGSSPAEEHSADAIELDGLWDPPVASEASEPFDDGFDDIFATLAEGEGEMANDLMPAADGVDPIHDGEADGPFGPWLVKYVPGTAAFERGGEPLLLLRELSRMGGVIALVDGDTVPSLGDLDLMRPYLGWTISLPGELSEDDVSAVFDFVGADCVVEITRAASGTAADCTELDHESPAIDLGDAGLSFDDDSTPTANETEGNPSRPDSAVIAALDPAPVSAAPADLPVRQPASPAQKVKPSPAVAPNAGGADLPSAESAAPKTASTATAPQTIRVDLDKLDRLVNLVGELVITQAMLAQRLSSNGLSNVTELTDLDHLTRELQDSAMSIRAQPVKTVFSRVPRIIRELEAQTGKRVRLEMEGEMTEIDKTVVERIGEPLTHLIRNAVDHGLEDPDERLSVGKPPEGVVRLSAEHRSGRIVISIRDDGRGINRERVRAKAVERGIISSDVVLSNEEIDNLIFAPGFSTAEQVSNISGRGVGMDVVRKNVQALGGRITIASIPGEGSTFSLSLPLTLAVLDGMIVCVGADTFVIPLSHIVESLRPAAHDVCQLGSRSLLNVRGNYVPIQNVGALLGVAEGQKKPEEAVLIVVETDGGQGILMVDSIQDQRQVVVKSLEANYRVVPGLAGATILGDGRVALILDVDVLVSQRAEEISPVPTDLAA